MESILSILSYIFWVGVAIFILVLIHELGHFLTAKLFGMRVEQFSIGFPPKVLSKKIGETEYRLGATPLGGYVRIAGMVDEGLDAEFEKQEPKDYEFRSKPVWQRIVVICAGVVFNVMLAIAIFIGLRYGYGEYYIPAESVESVYVAEGSVAYEMGLRTGDRLVAVNGQPIDRYDAIGDVRQLMADRMTITVVRAGEEHTFTAPDDLVTRLSRADEGFSLVPINSLLGISEIPAMVGGLAPNYPAEEAGLRPGDRIVQIEGEPVYFWNQMTSLIQESQGRELEVTVLRKKPDGTDELVPHSIVPRHAEGRYMLGIQPPTPDMLREIFDLQHRQYGMGEAVVAGVGSTWNFAVATVQGLRKVITGRENVRESIVGPVGIAQATKQAADRGAQDFWLLVAMLSITLAIVNILPIPALDGGHLVFLIYEGITRREPSLRIRMALQQIGMLLLLALFAFLIFNDIMRL